jgi:ClpP class serine protease
VAVIDDNAYSGGYGLACCADEIVISPTSGLGSIGVVMLHADYSAAIEAAGIKTTFVYAGAHKVDGNPYEALPASVKADLQAEVDAIYTRFCEVVGKGRRDKLTAAGAKATEARTYVGQLAIDAGLADRLGSFDEVVKELGARGAKRTRSNGGSQSMITEQEKAEHEAAVAKAKADGVKEGQAGTEAAVKAERDRVAGIMGLEEAKGRESQASALAAEGVSVESAKKILAAAPITSASTLAERAKAGADLGNLVDDKGPKPEAAKAAWGNVINKMNGGATA